MDKQLSAVQQILNDHIEKSDNVIKNASHAYGVAAFAASLAKKRGLNPKIAAISGLLHDISYIQSGTYDRHDELGADIAKEILLDLGLFSGSEIEIVYNAILRHDLRQEEHDPYDEVLKDADIAFPYFTTLPEAVKLSDQHRVSNLYKELLGKPFFTAVKE